MREILFRGKQMDDNEWIYGGALHQTDCYGMKVDRWYIIDGTETNDYNIGYPIRVIPETIGQYTGLTDKNGKKIFEGDVLRLVYNGDKHIYQVVYDVSELDFKATNGKEEYRTNFQYLTCCDEVEVIGNIRDNPELAEGLLIVTEDDDETDI